MLDRLLSDFGVSTNGYPTFWCGLSYHEPLLFLRQTGCNLVNAYVQFVKWWLTWLTTHRPNPSLLSKLARGVLLLGPFSLLVALLRLRLLLGKRTQLLGRTADGCEIRCQLPDLIQMYIGLFGVWEPDLTAFIRSRLRPGDVFIDVGANIGYFSLLASHQVGETGRVVAIDALPSNFAELESNLACNAGSGNVRALNRAVSDRIGTLDVFAGPAHNVGLATTAPGKRQDLKLEATVESAPLSKLLEPKEISGARLLKIDVEGAEPEVLRGIVELLDYFDHELEIVVELSPAWWREVRLTPEELLQPFRRAGFYSYVMDNNYWPWRYLWPDAVQRPRWIAQLSDKRVKRIDLVLSRKRVDHLS